VLRRLPSILLLIAFSVLGSGWLSHVHAQTHAMEDAAAAHSHAGHAGYHHHHEPSSDDRPSPDERPTHDETNCDLHAMLRAPVASLNATPALVVAGEITGRVSLGAESLVAQRTLARIACRGPPSF
jgi:hypothetical protein